MPVHDDAVAIADDLAGLRRRIHREPEIGLDLPKTQQKVLTALDRLPLELTMGRALSSVTAVLRGARPGATVLLRGDMDALPVTERTGLDYSSLTDGAMHACGHDLHTAMLTGAARLLAARQADLAGNVIFMILSGVFLVAGVLATRPGTMMAAADVLDVTVRGHGGHASRPYLAQDPIPAACEMVTALQTLVTRRFDVFDPVVITVGSFHAGTTDNVIPDEAHFLATVRSFSAAARDLVKDASVRLIADIAAGHGLQADADYIDGYPVTVNDAAATAFAEQTATGLLGGGRFVTQADPLTGAEDFSYVLEQVPGAFIMMGACPPGTDAASAPFNHAADAVFDDSVLADGAALLAELALRTLA